MQVTNPEQLFELKENEFIGELPTLTNSQINFNGINNILVCEEGVNLWNSRIDFNLNNSILYLSSDTHNYSVNISLHNDNICFIGKNNFFNGMTVFVLSESKNIFLGDDCFISYNVVFRTSDGHPIYNAESKRRENFAKSIYVGDHVWLKLIKDNSFWIPHSVHGWNEEDISKMSVYNSELFVYDVDDSTLNFDRIENDLNSFSELDDVVSYIWSTIIVGGKNRFTIK